MSMLSIRLSDQLTEQLNALTIATGRTKSFLAGQAIHDFVERESWQIAEINQALQEADSGDFASDEDLRIIREQWHHDAR